MLMLVTSHAVHMVTVLDILPHVSVILIVQFVSLVVIVTLQIYAHQVYCKDHTVCIIRMAYTSLSILVSSLPNFYKLLCPYKN